MIIIAGYLPLPLSVRAAMLPHIVTYVAACRAEPGCKTFDISFDAIDPERMRVFEIWEDEAAFQRHDSAPHVAVWRAARAENGVTQRFLTRYDGANAERTL